MEVHKHPHHVMHKKDWNEYALEFFMLFLAVFLGFLVENFHEHYVEKERLHQYLKSTHIDIDRNIASLDSCIRENTAMIKRYDPLVQGLMQNSTVDRSAFAKTLGVVWYRGFNNKNETFEQIKSSGTLRYVNNQELLSEILQ
jgi:hypothetical protein